MEFSVTFDQMQTVALDELSPHAYVKLTFCPWLKSTSCFTHKNKIKIYAEQKTFSLSAVSKKIF